MALPGMSAGTLTAIVTANTTGLTVGLKKAQAQVQAFSNNLQANMTANSAAIAGMGKAVIGMGLAITGALAIGISRFAIFDKAMKQSTAVSKVTAEQYKQMAKMAEEMSIELNIAADKTAKAFYFLGSAGLEPNEQMQSFNATLLLSKAGVMEVGAAAEILVDTMKGFKIPFTETIEVADQLTAGFTSANHTMSQLGESMSYAAGISKAFNNDLVDIIASFGFFADIGIKGSMAGTAMRRSLLNLAAPTSAMRKELDKFVDVYDRATGKMRPFIDIMADYTDAIKDISEQERNMSIKTIFGARAISGMIAVIDRGGDALRTYRDEIKNAGGETQRVADIQMSAFSEQLGKTFKILDAIARKVGEIAVNEIAGDLDTLNGKLKETNDLLDQNNQYLTASIKGTVAFYKVLGKVIKTIFQGIVSITVMIGGIVRILFKFSEMMDLIIQKVSDVLDAVFIGTLDGIWSHITEFGQKFESFIHAVLMRDWDTLKEIITTPFEAKFNFNDLTSQLAGLKDDFKDDFKDIENIINNTIAVLDTLGRSILGISSGVGAGAEAEAEADTGGGGITAGIEKAAEAWRPLSIAVSYTRGEIWDIRKELAKIKPKISLISQGFQQMGYLIKSSISDTLADAFMGAKVKAEDFFKYLTKQLLKMGIMMALNAMFPGAGVLAIAGGEKGGLFQNVGGKFNIPAFAGGVSGYQIPSNIPMDTLPVMVGGGEEIDVRSIGQVADRDNLLKQQIGVLNKIVATLYKTQTVIGDIAIYNAAESGKLQKGDSL